MLSQLSMSRRTLALQVQVIQVQVTQAQVQVIQVQNSSINDQVLNQVFRLRRPMEALLPHTMHRYPLDMTSAYCQILIPRQFLRVSLVHHQMFSPILPSKRSSWWLIRNPWRRAFLSRVPLQMTVRTLSSLTISTRLTGWGKILSKSLTPVFSDLLLVQTL